jgi:hypothetical protein
MITHRFDHYFALKNYIDTFELQYFVRAYPIELAQLLKNSFNSSSPVWTSLVKIKYYLRF